MTRYSIVVWACFLVLSSGCGGYGSVSPKTYQLATSLYNISNRRLPDKLAVAKEAIETALDEGTISKKEAGWLKAIVRNAESEKWGRAMKAARSIMEDQVRN